MIWFTADTHFGHQNILSHCNRPFKSIEEMDSVILDNINKLVLKGDTLYHLGDFAWCGKEELYRKKINCKQIVLIRGNHDYRAKQSKLKDLFSGLHDLLHIEYGGASLALCHYPIAVWNKRHYGSYNLYGHCHGNFRAKEQTSQLDVGVDCHNFAPISFDQVKEILTKRNPT